MSNVLSILDEIAGDPSKNAKVELIKKHVGNQTFMNVLDAALHPYRTYHIKKIPVVNEHTGAMTLDEFIGNLHIFENRVVTGHAASDFLAESLSKLNEDDADVAIRILRRKLKSGFEASTVNKAKPGTIPVHPCLLATKESPAALKKIIFPAYSQIKADGLRANVVLEGGKVKIYGRSGKFIDLLDRFAFLSHFEGDGVMLDGELLVLDKDGNILSRAKGNGMINKAITGSVTEEIADSVIFVIWDAIPLDEFYRVEKKAPEGATPYKIRWEAVKTLVKTVNSPKIRQIECKIVNNMEEVGEHYDHVRELDEEGLILKNIDHPWENRRSQHLVKLKARYDCDLEVIGWNYGEVGGEFEHTLGSLICASSDRKVVVSTSWFSLKLRTEIFENFDEEWMGRIVTISYNARGTKDGSDVDSLFIPGFEERREDKDVADHSDDIEWG